MDFEKKSFGFLASLILFLKRALLLVLYPYKTMRRISRERDTTQLWIIFFFVFSYFLIADKVRLSADLFPLHFIVTMINFIFTVYFFYFLARLFSRETSLMPFIFTLGYSLIPTLIWFFTNLILFVLLPPPRTWSLPGTLFSVIYIIFSISLLFWKLILVYLGIRFSSKLSALRIVYYLALYLCIFLPYSFFLYLMALFRIPFI